MKTMECTPRDTLKRYLTGWIDGEQGSQIEEHLAACEACEQTLLELEHNPDTLLDALRRRAELPPDRVENDAKLGQAVSNVRRLMDVASCSGLPFAQTIPDQIGMYEIVGPLGRGGMATVYLARHRSLGKLVAVKLRPSVWRESDEGAARFEREIRASGKLNHPSIVNATDAGEQDGIQYLVMEYIQGMDLGRIARHIRLLKTADACEMMRQVALGLSHAHAEGIVHRDIKPSNLMLDEKGRVKILDFGLAQVDLWDEATAELTSVGQLMGTLDYMSPEQAEGSGAVDYRADLYSLGSTLFRLLCGRAPLAAAPNVSPLDKLRLLAKHQPPRLDTLRDDAPRELAELVEALLSRDPEDRPPSAAHVAERLAVMATGAALPALLAEAKATEAAKGMSHDGSGRSDLAAVSFLPPMRRTSDGRGNRIRKWLAMAALVPLAFLATVIVILETQKGNLVIESQVAGVTVKVTQDGKTVESLRVEAGTTLTRLMAGKYEVLIDSPSDTVIVDQDEFVVKKGSTTIARITQKPRAATDDSLRDRPRSESRNSPSTTDDSSSQRKLVYEGRTLDDWLEQLATDRSTKAIGDALFALDAMLLPENAAKIRNTLMEVLPTLNGQTRIERGNTIDRKGFEILAKSMDSKSFLELMGKEVVEGDVKWARRVLTQTQMVPLAYSDTAVKPLIDQLDTGLFRNTQLDASKATLIELGSEWLWRILFTLEAGTELRDQVIEIVNSSPLLKTNFWLSKPPYANWPPMVEKIVVQRAAQVLADPDSEPFDVTRACMILFVHLRLRGSSWVVDIDAVANSIQAQLERLAKDKGRAFAVLDLGERIGFQEFSGPVFARGKRVSAESYTKNPEVAVLSNNGILQFAFDGKLASETQELLDLALLVKSKHSKQFDTRSIMALTRETYLGMRKAIPPENLDLEWPTFNATGGTAIAMREVADFSPERWLGYLFHIQAAQVSGDPVPLYAPLEETEPAKSP